MLLYAAILRIDRTPKIMLSISIFDFFWEYFLVIFDTISGSVDKSSFWV